MKLSPLFLSAALSLTGLPALADIEIHHAYGRVMGAMAKSGAVFMGVMNTGDADDRLIGAQSDVARKVELHTHIKGDDGVMMMRHVPDGFVIPAGGGHHLERGGDHVMLMGLTEKLADGDLFTLTLVFEQAGEITIEVEIDNDRVAEDMDENHDHSEGHSHGG